MREKDRSRRSRIGASPAHEQGPFQQGDWQRNISYRDSKGNRQGWKPDYNRDRMEYGPEINELAGDIIPRGKESVSSDINQRRGEHREGMGTQTFRTRVEPLSKSRLEREQEKEGTYKYYDAQGNVKGGSGIESTSTFVRPQTEVYYGPNEEGHIVPTNNRYGGKRKKLTKRKKQIYG